MFSLAVSNDVEGLWEHDRLQQRRNILPHMTLATQIVQHVYRSASLSIGRYTGRRVFPATTGYPAARYICLRRWYSSSYLVRDVRIV